MIPISRRTIRSAIARCSPAGRRLEVDVLRHLALGGADAHALREQVHQQRRGAVHVVDRVRRPRGRRSAAARRAAPGRRPTPGPRAARTRTTPTARSREPRDRAPYAGHEVQRQHRDPDDEMKLSHSGRGRRESGWPRLRRKALCNTLLQEWCITRSSARIAPLRPTRRGQGRCSRATCPVLVFLGLGSAVGLAFTTLEPRARPAPAEQGQVGSPTSAACPPTCSAASASGSAST